MKYLSHYTEKKIDKLLEDVNGFFAFGQEQFDNAKKEGIDYVWRGAGLYHEKGKSKEFDEKYELIVESAIQQDIEENGQETIIERELCNFEAYYTGEIEETVERLEDYNITAEQVLEVFKKNQSKHYDD